MPAARANDSRNRIYQLAALLVTAAAAAAVLVAVLGSGSTSQLRPGRPVPGSAQTLRLFAGIPQHGESLGTAGAPITLFEFGDLQCPACSQFATDTLPAIVSSYVRPGRIALVLRPLDFIGADSRRAAAMALALGQQGRMWQFAELMYRNQGLENSGYVTDTYLRALASALPGVDVGRALAQRGSASVRAQLAEAKAQAHAAHLASTPSFLIARAGHPPQRFTPSGLYTSSFVHALDRALAGS
jgi:protein-disulfide isomerase